MKDGNCGMGNCSSCEKSNDMCKGCGSPCLPGHGKTCTLWFLGKLFTVLGIVAAITAMIMSTRGLTILWLDDTLMYMKAIILLLLAILMKMGYREHKKRLMMKMMMTTGCGGGGSKGVCDESGCGSCGGCDKSGGEKGCGSESCCMGEKGEGEMHKH